MKENEKWKSYKDFLNFFYSYFLGFWIKLQAFEEAYLGISTLWWVQVKKKILYEKKNGIWFWKKPHWNIFKNIHGWHLKNCHGLDGANQVVRCFPVSAFRDLSSLKLDHNCLPHSMLQKMEKKGRFSLVFVLFRQKTACCWVPCACYDVNVLVHFGW